MVAVGQAGRLCPAAAPGNDPADGGLKDWSVEIWVYNQYSDEREVVKVAKEGLTIGRDETNDVTLRSQFVSRKHARVFWEAGNFFLESLGLNGTNVANKLIPYKQRGKIDYGDEIRIGEFSIYMMEPSQRRIHAADRVVSPRKRVMEIEQKMFQIK